MSTNRKKEFSASVVLFLILFFFPLQARQFVRQLKIETGDSTVFYHYFYDANGKVRYERQLSSQNNKLVNRSQTEWLTVGDSLHIQRGWKWHTTEWVKSYEFRTWKQSGDLIIKEEKYEFSTGEAVLCQRSVMVEDKEGQGYLRNFYSYDSGKPQLMRQQRLLKYEKTMLETDRYFRADTLVLELTTSYYYQPTSDLPDSVKMEDSTTGESWLTEYSYDKHTGRIITQLTRRGELTGTSRMNHTRIEYTYNQEGKLSTEVFYSYSGKRWVPTYRNVYEYNNDGVLTEKTYFTALYREWRKLNTIHYSDFTEGYPLQVFSGYNFWGGREGEPFETSLPVYFNGKLIIRQGSRINIEYNTTGLENHGNNTASSETAVYPNPTSGQLFFRSSGNSLHYWELFNLQGKLILNGKADIQSNRIDLSGAGSGVYLLRLIDTEQKTSYERVIINK